MEVTYEPITDDCRICGNEPPHEWRVSNGNVEVICLECKALLEILVGGAALIVSEVEQVA